MSLNLKSLRTNAGLTQLELSKIVGTTPQFIHNMEKGAGATGTPIPIKKLKLFARAYNIPVKQLIDYRVEEFRAEIKKTLRAK